MKRYVNYMDSVSAPEELLGQIENTRPVKRPFPVARVAGIAAALAVALGLGAAMALGGDERELLTTDPGGRELATIPGGTEPAILQDPDTHQSDPGDKPMGWYQIADGESVVNIGYPVLNFADASGLPQTALNYWLGAPYGTERALTSEDLDRLLGQRFLEHLGLPADTQVSGTLYFTSDRVPCGAEIFLDAGDRTLYIEELAGNPVPSCVEPADELYGLTDYQDTQVRTLTGLNGEDSCEVSFFLNGTGWKATVREESYEELASRFVRLAVYDLNAGLKAAQWEYAPLPETPGQPSGGGAMTQSYDPTKK